MNEPTRELFETPPIDDEIRAVEREIRMREGVYPKWVRSGRMTQARADKELAAMRGVLRRLQGIASRTDVCLLPYEPTAFMLKAADEECAAIEKDFRYRAAPPFTEQNRRIYQRMLLAHRTWIRDAVPNWPDPVTRSDPESWAYSSDEEVWSEETGFASREDAMAAARAEFADGEHGGFYTGRIQAIDWPALVARVMRSAAESISEQLAEAAYEEIGEVAEGWPDRAAIPSLATELTATVLEFFKDPIVAPHFYRVVDIQGHNINDASGYDASTPGETA